MMQIQPNLPKQPMNDFVQGPMQYQPGWEERLGIPEAYRPSTVVPLTQQVMGDVMGDEELLRRASEANSQNARINAYNNQLKAQVAESKHKMLIERLNAKYRGQETEAYVKGQESQIEARKKESEREERKTEAYVTEKYARAEKALSEARVQDILTTQDPLISALSVLRDLKLKDENLTQIAFQRLSQIYSNPDQPEALRRIEGILFLDQLSLTNDPELFEDNKWTKKGLEVYKKLALDRLSDPDIWNRIRKESGNDRTAEYLMRAYWSQSELTTFKGLKHKESLYDQWRQRLLEKTDIKLGGPEKRKELRKKAKEKGLLKHEKKIDHKPKEVPITGPIPDEPDVHGYY